MLVTLFQFEIVYIITYLIILIKRLTVDALKNALENRKYRYFLFLINRHL